MNNINELTDEMKFMTIIAIIMAFSVIMIGSNVRSMKIDMEQIRADSCYTEYEWSDAHQVNTVTRSYCPDA